MKTGRRLFALVAILAIAWGALWPLISAAGPKPREIANFICTQSGFQPSHADGLAQPAIPDGAHDKFHCPLCVVTADATLPVVEQAATWTLFAAAPRIEPFAAAFHPRVAARPPPSRAPPALS